MTQPTEKTFYSEGGVTITDKRAVLGSTTYPLANVSSVGVGVQTPSGAPGLALLVIGLALGGCGLTTLGSRDPNYWTLVIGAALFVLGLAVLRGNREKYFVKIGSAGGEQRALMGTDKAQVE